MGNANKKHKRQRSVQSSGEVHQRDKTSFSQFNLSSFVSNLSGRSVQSFRSQHSSYSVSRPWSRVSRRRWHNSTLNDPLEASKTAWPVPYIEAVFLPEFKINADVTEKDFMALDVISKGAFGKVFKVQKINTSEIYALKVLSKSQVMSENSVRQVKDEVSIQSMCGHNPFIVHCPFYWQNRRKLFIVSEYVPGGELLQLCQDYGPLPEEIARLYVAELALALDFLHNAGVVYRDLKLENVLLDAECHAQVIDFGLAKWLPYGSRTTTICGTLQYMAPEVVSMEPYGHAVDWWSLGVVTCCLLSGQPPEPLSATPPILPGALPDWMFSPAASALLRRLLDRDPRTRLRSLLALQGTAFFKDFSFADARSMKVSPRRMLEEYFPHGPPATYHQDAFRDFDSDLATV